MRVSFLNSIRQGAFICVHAQTKGKGVVLIFLLFNLISNIHLLTLTMIIVKSCRTVVCEDVTRLVREEHLLEVNFSVAEMRRDLIVITLAVSWLKQNVYTSPVKVLPCKAVVFRLLRGEKRKWIT